jgi:hypothetical protein
VSKNLLAEPSPSTESPNTNGHKPVKTEADAIKQETTPPSSRAVSSPPTKSEPDSDEEDRSPPKKKRKQGKESDDAKLAALLQAQENRSARATRGGNKKVIKKVPKKPRKKSEKKIKADDDSGLEEIGSDGEVKEKVKKGGFHKQYYLSAPLSELVGEAKVSCQLGILRQLVCSLWNSTNQEYSSRDLRLSRRFGSTSRNEICRTQPTNVRFGAMRNFSRSSRPTRCTCLQ